MKTIARSSLLAAGVLLAACSTGVVPAGPDTYMISRPIMSFTTTGRGMAANYREANRWCAERGLVMVPITKDEQRPLAGAGGRGVMGTADLYFHALRPGDPEIERSHIAIPDTVERVEMR